MVNSATLERLLNKAGDDRLTVLTVELDDPSGYGRIIRNADGQIQAIVEEKDASPEQRAIREVNTGLLACPVNQLSAWLEKLQTNNVQGEYYLTDIVSLAVDDGLRVETVAAKSETEVMGINDKIQLAQAERAYQKRLANELMVRGVGILDPARIDIRGSLICGKDVVLDINTVFEGVVELGDGVTIGPNSVVRTPGSHREPRFMRIACWTGPRLEKIARSAHSLDLDRRRTSRKMFTSEILSKLRKAPSVLAAS